jgi:Icc-related predicted phosphoesterase
MSGLHADVTIALMHFSPTVSTLGREPIAKYWMLGNCELGVVLDRHRPDLVIHGHAHLGNLEGHTVGGLPVRNVAVSITSDVYIEAVSSVERETVSAAAHTWSR